jgi:hypothetical protein
LENNKTKLMTNRQRKQRGGGGNLKNIAPLLELAPYCGSLNKDEKKKW